ncbi:MAG: DUF4422 domain-containing protein [Bacillus sp. (in: Bacteria)]|nr:DUF4422 domain-containing protein [Bacillus sp. (in: firmicutes)]MCM1425853.1 DUF4422 domain-containing protein [Eubacterium sp.]
MNKLISIIIPCYNVEAYIDRCFQSILAQTIGFDKLEIILVDDCSTDHTWEKLRAIEASYPESVMIIHCDENGHQGTARNIGMEYASAPYIGFVDSDDWIEPDMYEKLYEKITIHHCDIAMCRNWRDYGFSPDFLEPKQTGEEDRIFQIDTIEKRKTFLACGSIGYGVWDKLYTRELLLGNNIFFPEHLAYEDHFFSILLYFYAQKIYMLEERLYHYFVNPASTVLTPNASHHFNILAVDTMMWAECERRGFLETYRKEIEYQFLCLCYLASLKMISLRLTQLPYDFFLQLKEETLKRVPDYHTNPYIKDYVTPLNQSLLGLLDYPISETDLKTVCTSLRKNFIKNTLSIFVMTHVKFDPPQNPIYHPLHVGHALHEDLGYPGDDTGDNISDLNMYYSELTGLYWAWKNVQNTEYIGLCHYRRYFLNDKNSIMTKADFIPILAKYQVIISQPVTSDKCYRDGYGEAHNIHDLEAVGAAIGQLYPDCMSIFNEVLNGCKLYCGNLFVTTKELFDDYAEWLFSIFNVASKQIDTSSYDDYHKRVYGFLSEQLLYVWVRYRNLAYYEAPIGFTQEKAETLSLKEQLSALLKEHKIEEARTLFLETMKHRPDVMLPGSDFNRELAAYYNLIMEEQKK